MDERSREDLRLTDCGRQDCSDLHAWGPGIRTCYIIHYIIRGRGTLEYEGKSYHLQAGESFLICPRTMIRYYPDPEEPWEYTWVNFTGAEEWLQACVMNSSHPVCPALPAEEVLPLYERMRRIDPYRANRREGQGLLAALLGLYADRFPAEPPAWPDEEEERLQTARAFIQAGYSQAWFGTDALCERLHCSRATLYRLFRRRLQTSPGEYLQEYRIRQACDMLRRGMSVKAAAFSCGFADPLYFSRVFKQKIGKSPSEYRAGTK